MQIVILAGGLGRRLKPLTEHMPKSLVPVNGRSLLEYQLEPFKENGMRDMVLCVGYLGEQIKRQFGGGSQFRRRHCLQ